MGRAGQQPRGQLPRPAEPPGDDTGTACRLAGAAAHASGWWHRVAHWARASRLDLIWVGFVALNLLAMRLEPNWGTVPFLAIWVSLTAIYGVRLWRLQPTILTLAAVTLATGGIIVVQVLKGQQDADYLAEVPLIALMFLVMVWHGRRRVAAMEEQLAAMEEVQRVSQENLHLLTQQHRFLQDASHELGTPITVALGHAELMERAASETEMAEDARVVADELRRLGRLATRILLLASACSPDFLRREPVAVESVLGDALERWGYLPRRWRLGPVTDATVLADRDRLGAGPGRAAGERASRTPSAGDQIEVSARREDGQAVLAVADSGCGIAPADLQRIFHRFARASTRGTATARRAASGSAWPSCRPSRRRTTATVRVRSTPGQGAIFEIFLPLAPADAAITGAEPAAGSGSGGRLVTRQPVPHRRPAPPRPCPAAPAGERFVHEVRLPGLAREISDSWPRIVDRVVGALAAQRLPDLAGRGQRHLPPDSVNRRAEMRREQRPGAGQAGRDLRRVPGQRPVLHREDVCGVAAEPPGVQRSATASSSTTEPRPTFTRNAPGRISRSADRPTMRRVPDVKGSNAMTTSLPASRSGRLRRAACSRCSAAAGRRPGVVVDDPGAERRQQRGQRLPDLAHAHDPGGGAAQRRAVEARAPAGEPVLADVPVGLGQPAHYPDDQAGRELGGRRGQQVRQDGQPDPAPGARVGVEVVVALERRADDAQPRAATQERVVDAVGHGHDQAARVGRELGHPVDGPDAAVSLVRAWQHRVAEAGQVVGDLRVHPVGDDDLRHAS